MIILTPVLVASEMNKSYIDRSRKVHAVRDVSFHVGTGELLVIRGRSGSGKSTLLNVLGLLSKPDSGSLSLDGTEVASISEHQAADLRATKLGFMFQSYNLLQHLTAVENVALAVAGSTGRANQRARKALADVGLEDRLDHLPSAMSGGEQQRVALARATINMPRLILADEPTGNLDQSSEQMVLQYIRQSLLSGCAAVLVSHSESVLDFADRVLTMSNGQLSSVPPGGRSIGRHGA